MFDYTLSNTPDAARIEAQGRIDALSASEIQDAFNRLILEGSRLLIVDLAAVHYISSAGLRVFITAQKELKKVGGEILLSNLTPQVMEIFKVSGFDQLFRFLSNRDGATELPDTNQDIAPHHVFKSEALSLNYFENKVPPGSLFTIGSIDKMETASYTEDDVIAVPASSMRLGCGLAALGDNVDEYRNLFGEAMVINSSFFYYPAVRHSSVDFLLAAHTDTSTAYRFLHGFGVNGDYRYRLSFKSESGAVDLANLIQAFLSVSQADLLGVELLAESRGILGMNLKKPPLADAQSRPQESIFSGPLLPEWFDFPMALAHPGAVIAAAGLIARDPARLPARWRPLFPGDAPFHLHTGIFDKAPLCADAHELEREFARVFSEFSVSKIQHLMGRSRLGYGMAGLIEIEV